MVNKIHICGIYGCGKSALAKKLSEILNILHHSLDDLKYEVKYTKIRSVEERIKRVKEICKEKKWITEGSWSNYAEDAFRKADLVIFMLIPRIICSYRIMKRYLFRKKGKKDNLIEALKLVRGVYRYHSTNQPVSLISHKRLIDRHVKRVFIIKNNSDIFKLIKLLKTSRDIAF